VPRPTEKAVKRRPQAIVFHAWDSDDLDTLADADFEWFETDANRAAYFEETHAWSVQSHKDENGLVCYLTAEITDTATMTLGRVRVVPQTKEMKAKAQAVRDDPLNNLLVPGPKRSTPPVAEPKAKPKKEAAKGTPAAAPTKPSTRVVRKPANRAGVPDESAPAPKARAPRKHAAPPPDQESVPVPRLESPPDLDDLSEPPVTPEEAEMAALDKADAEA